MRKTLIAALFAATMLLTACSAQRENILAYRDAGIAAMQEENYEAAAEAFAHALNYFGTARPGAEQIDILCYLADAEFRSGDYAAAAEYYKRLLSGDKRRNEYLNLAAVSVLKSGGDPAEAMELFNEATENNDRSPLHREALYIVGEILSSGSDETLREQALSLYEAAVEREGMTAGLAIRIGRMHFGSGEYETAVSVFRSGLEAAEAVLADEKASEAAKTEADSERKALIYNEGVALEYMRDFDGALACFNRVLSEYGSDEELLHEIRFAESRR